MIKVTVNPPPVLIGYLGNFETTPGKTNLRRECDPTGTEAERFAFRRYQEQIVAILNSLSEIGCVASVSCSIKNGEFQSSGSIRLWFNGCEQAVKQALVHLHDFGWQAARCSPKSSAEIHAMVSKTVLGKVA